MVRSLREYLSLMDQKGWVLPIKDRVFREDMPEIIERLSQKKRVLLFEDVDGYDCRVVANLVPEERAFSLLFDGAENPYDAFLKGVERVEKKVKVERKGYSTIEIKDDDEIMDFLPILKHYVEDSAPYITTSIVSAVDPETSIVGRGIHRMEYRGNNRLGVSLVNPPLTDIMEKYRSSGKDMPLSVVIGVDPIMFISMALKVPHDVDKLEVTGGIKGEAVEVMESFDSLIDVPFGSEIILEGFLDYHDLRKDGPLGEISGYYMNVEKTPTLRVRRISFQQNPLYHVLLPASIEGDMYLDFVSGAHMEERAKRLFPFLMEINFVKKTFGSSVVAKIRPVGRDKIKSLIVFLLSFPMIKKVVVVDEDVDGHDLNDVEWAVITRCHADEDILIIPGLSGQVIDPEARRGTGVAKVGINATSYGKSLEGRAVVIKGDEERIRKVLSSIKEEG
ncbi:MAG: UbiD family decarboxylase [Syntrophorhabdaceae bacterium]|nr:UbiD family decarboxylase [Syntrophorhabdaceae bacterium]